MYNLTATEELQHMRVLEAKELWHCDYSTWCKRIMTHVNNWGQRIMTHVNTWGQRIMVHVTTWCKRIMEHENTWGQRIMALWLDAKELWVYVNTCCQRHYGTCESLMLHYKPCFHMLLREASQIWIEEELIINLRRRHAWGTHSLYMGSVRQGDTCTQVHDLLLSGYCAYYNGLATICSKMIFGLEGSLNNWWHKWLLDVKELWHTYKHCCQIAN